LKRVRIVPKSGDKRADGRIWSSGAWRDEAGIQKHREDKKKWQESNKEKYKQSARKHYENNRERRIADTIRYNTEVNPGYRKRYYEARGKELWAKYWQSKTEEQRKEISKRRYERLKERVSAEERRTISREGYRRRNPTAILNHALSEFRSGAIGVDELNRRYDEAIKRADEILSETRQRKRKPIRNDATS